MNLRLRALLPASLVLVGVWSGGSPADTSSCAQWRLWQAYADRFIQADGRVVEFSADARTTSEGQAYALLFSLVANDRKRFERILAWTEDNLVQGRLGDRLPAWLWGKDGDGRWQVLDANAASDADLWMAYALLEAGRLWSEPELTARARALMERIKASEVVCLPQLGPMLLPGPYGFRTDEKTWRFNPSYLPLQLLRALAEHDPGGPWQRLAENTVTMIQATAPKGLVPDWVAYDTQKGFIPDPIKGSIGSFDAIRVYLWAGMLDARDALASALLEAISGMQQLLDEIGMPPMYLDATTGTTRDAGPVGFSAALLPYLNAGNNWQQLARQRRRVLANRFSDLIGQPPRYYDQNLALFGEGALDGRIRFASNGQLLLSWVDLCHASSSQHSSSSPSYP
jgi:endoglucanase